MPELLKPLSSGVISKIKGKNEVTIRVANLQSRVIPDSDKESAIRSTKLPKKT